MSRGCPSHVALSREPHSPSAAGRQQPGCLAGPLCPSAHQASLYLKPPSAFLSQGCLWSDSGPVLNPGSYLETLNSFHLRRPFSKWGCSRVLGVRTCRVILGPPFSPPHALPVPERSSAVASCHHCDHGGGLGGVTFSRLSAAPERGKSVRVSKQGCDSVTCHRHPLQSKTAPRRRQLWGFPEALASTGRASEDKWTLCPHSLRRGPVCGFLRT